jgi:Zn-dependent protease with chaperone function
MNWHDNFVLVATLLGPFHNLWPLFVAPAAASLISDRTARFVPQTTTGSIVAAMLAAAPGLVGLAVIFQAIDVWHHVRTWHGVVFYWITPAIAVGLVAYAFGRAMQRQSQVARLFAVAEPARGHLARAAAELGARVLQIPTDDKECFVAGVLQPTIFVSRGALAKLDDATLMAALQHECAHMRGRDISVITALAFLRDLAPWGHGAALEAFRTTREVAADQAAARLAGPLNLATALIALARSGHDDQRALTLSIARGSNFRSRMQALLDGDKREKTSVHTWARLAGGLSLSLMLLLWPVVQVQALELICSYY